MVIIELVGELIILLAIMHIPFTTNWLSHKPILEKNSLFIHFGCFS